MIQYYWKHMIIGLLQCEIGTEAKISMSCSFWIVCKSLPRHSGLATQIVPHIMCHEKRRDCTHSWRRYPLADVRRTNRKERGSSFDSWLCWPNAGLQAPHHRPFCAGLLRIDLTARSFEADRSTSISRASPNTRWRWEPFAKWRGLSGHNKVSLRKQVYQ